MARKKHSPVVLDDDAQDQSDIEKRLVERKIPVKQRQFVVEYLKDFDRARAYRAVYDVRNRQVAYVNAGRLLRNAYISELIADEVERALGPSRAELRLNFERHILAVLRADPSEFLNEAGEFEVSRMLESESRAIQALTVERTEEGFRATIRLRDSGKALDLAARVLGYLDRDGDGERPVIVVRSLGLPV
jgi:hypothetical protein